MAEDSFRRFYVRSDFTSLPGNVIDLPLLTTILLALNASLSQPIIDLRELPGESGVVLEWRLRPSDADLLLVDGAIHAFVGGITTNEPFEIESLGLTSEAAGTLTDKINFTTPQLSAGTYQVLWDALVGMLLTVTNAGVRGVITLTRMNSDGSGPVARTWEHNWNLQQPQTFSGGITFKCSAGQKIKALLQVQKIGAPAATAQMANARITIDQLSADG